MKAALPENEVERLGALRSYRILDTPAEPAFDDLTLLAAQICQTPIALISLVDEKRQWFKSKLGTNTAETSRDVAFCAHAILHPDQIFEVNDARKDPRFSASALVTADPHARFYAGAPLVTRTGHVLGALCVIDREPRDLSAEQLAGLRALGRQVVAQLELRRESQQLAEEEQGRRHVEEKLRQQNEKLARSQEEASRLLGLAEQSRRALLSILEDEQRTSQELVRSNRALKMLSSCNEALIVAQEEGHLLHQVCQIAVEIGGHRMAFVGYAEEETKRIVPMARWGDDSGYLNQVELTFDDERPEGRGPAGQCVRSGNVVACRDIQDPASGFHSTGEAEISGFRSVVCLPLRDAGRTFGVVGLYSSEVGDVPEPELKLLRELTADLAFGIGALRSRVVQERAEEALVASLREKEALLKEVHHRVKNNLQVIASLLRLEGRRISHPTTNSVLNEMQGRIQSMALLHETLYRSGNFSRVDLGSYIGQLAHQLFRSLASHSGAIQLRLDLATVHLEIDQAIPCGLIVNELASNSLKHGFAEAATGEVWIRLRFAPGGALSLSVADNGAGLPEDFNMKAQRSLGLQLVSDLTRQLQGSLRIGTGPGAEFEVTFVPSRTESPSPVAATLT